VRSFTERNPVIIGAVVVAVIALGTTGALALNAGMLEDRYTVHARFPDTAGLRKGDQVRVAGVVSGQVGSVRQHEGEVEVDLQIDERVELPGDVRAEIVVETLLGSKYVRMVGGDDWARPLRSGDLILDTASPTEVLDVQQTGTPLLEELDGAALDDLLVKIEAVTDGQRGNVGEIIVGLDRLAGAIDERQDAARRLISSSRTVVGTLAARDEELLAALDDLDLVLDGLAVRRVQVVKLLEETEAAARATADLVADNRAQIDAILEEIHLTLQVVARNQDDLAAGLSGMANAISGFASVGYSGPDEVPNRWANMFTQLIGPLGPDALFGSCGLLDDAFDVLVGPDPVTDCEARTGPLPSAVAAGDAADGSEPPADGGAAGPPAIDPMTALYGPLLEEGS
jgi:phospholipid/cholesterol/gamma-HCH transport system substrate-binding protein